MSKEEFLVGWREWASLPDLGVPLIKVKIDTGAKTSALHAYDMKIVKFAGKEYAEFMLHPIQNNDSVRIFCRAEVTGTKIVKSSNGHKEIRPVITTLIKIGNYSLNIDITLTNRDIMYHRMLLGREAMKNLLVNPSRSYCQGKYFRDKIKFIYQITTIHDSGSV